MTENMVRFIMVQIIDIVQKLAKNHVAHRDIKDENIMINLSTYQGNFPTNCTKISDSDSLKIFEKSSFSKKSLLRRIVFFGDFLSKYDWLKIWKSN